MDGRRWIACRPGFFLPVKVLSRRFRKLYLQYLEQAYAAGKLQFHGDLEQLADAQNFARYLAPLAEMEWVVYAKPPFGGSPGALIRLRVLSSRQTHRPTTNPIQEVQCLCSPSLSASCSRSASSR